MFHFDTFMIRHGEVAAQALIEKLESYEGIRANIAAPLALEVRWERLMRAQQDTQYARAA